MKLYDHQKLALTKLKTGSILVGGVGSGKSLTSLQYFFNKICDDRKHSNLLLIITTARKRDTKEWEKECSNFMFADMGVDIVIDSWNNIEKYVGLQGKYVIFDEQRAVGSGKWAKSFIKIAKKNDWIMLSATPGDTWSDYIPVFVANGFYKNPTEFVRTHVVFKPFMKYPVVDHYVETKILEQHRNDILVYMDFKRKAVHHPIDVITEYNHKDYFYIVDEAWNIYKDEPIRDASGLSQALRRCVNSDPDRIKKTAEIVKKKIGCIIFYNFDYELELLIDMCEREHFDYSQWNGHKHEPIPATDKNYWCYLVQYTAGAEGWNCIETDTIIFYSQNHSYKIMTQAAGRIDRLNTPFANLYFYTLKSKSKIDLSISRCLRNKKDFNENKYYEDTDEFSNRY